MTNQSPSAPPVAVTYADIASASERLAPVANRTPVLTSRAFNTITGAEVFFKAENFQRVGAFKFRGAYNAMSRLSPDEKTRGVLTFSSGNHAQATALAGKLLGVSTTIIMPKDAPRLKLNATRAYGADVILYDRSEESREALANELAQERNLTIIPPFDHPHVIAGQGTVAKELLEKTGPLDMLIVCVGGGGLISGCAITARELAPHCKIIGVEPDAGNDGVQSFRAGKLIRIDTPNTIADGASTNSLGEHTFAIIHSLVTDMVSVPDAALVRAMRFFFERMKIVVEPTGSLAAAALMEEKIQARNKRIGVIISGGNVDAERFASLMQT